MLRGIISPISIHILCKTIEAKPNLLEVVGYFRTFYLIPSNVLLVSQKHPRLPFLLYLTCSLSSVFVRLVLHDHKVLLSTFSLGTLHPQESTVEWLDFLFLKLIDGGYFQPLYVLIIDWKRVESSVLSGAPALAQIKRYFGSTRASRMMESNFLNLWCCFIASGPPRGHFMARCDPLIAEKTNGNCHP